MCIRDSKGVGLLLPQAKLRHVTMIDCQLRLINLSGCVNKAAAFTRCDLSEGVLNGCGWHRTPLRECRMVGCHVTGTSFDGVDLTTCEVEGWALGGGELKGALVTRDQAAAFALLLGLVIKG